MAIILLAVLVYAGYEDFRKRKITTIGFLIFDIALFIYYIFVDFWIALFLIPVVLEFFSSKLAPFFYVVLIVPLIFDLSVVTISLAYSIFLVKLFQMLIRNFGRGDVKALQTLAIAVPLYPHLTTIDSLFPPVLAVALVASVMGTIASVVKSREANRDDRIRKFSLSTAPDVPDTDRFWIKDSKRIYKIPFVTFIAVGYALLFILSLLRLV